MLFEPASVVETSPDTVRLQTRRSATCAGCSLKSGCGQYLLAPKDEILPLPRNTLTNSLTDDVLQPGTQVLVSLAPAQLMRLAFLFYLLPLGTLLSGTVVALLFGFGESGAILGAGAGLATGLLGARHALHRQGRTISLALQDHSGRSGDSL